MNSLQQPIAIGAKTAVPLVVLHHVGENAPPAPCEGVAAATVSVLHTHTVVETNLALHEAVESGVDATGSHPSGEGVLTACRDRTEGGVDENAASIIA